MSAIEQAVADGRAYTGDPDQDTLTGDGQDADGTEPGNDASQPTSSAA